MATASTGDLYTMTAQIVSAHVRFNSVSADQLPELIKTVYRSLTALGGEQTEPTDLIPAVPVKQSVFPDYIICLEDGLKLKTLRRHLRTSYSMTPEQYREKWDLPGNYPMTAPNYSARRSQMAKDRGFGRRERNDEPPVKRLAARRARGAKG